MTTMTSIQIQGVQKQHGKTKTNTEVRVAVLYLELGEVVGNERGQIMQLLPEVAQIADCRKLLTGNADLIASEQNVHFLNWPNQVVSIAVLLTDLQ